MREKINKLARGLVDLEIPRLRLSNTSFAGELAAGERRQFELLLVSENGVQLKGLAYSSHPKVRILKEAFGGVRTKLGFEVDSREAGDGDVISGNLDLVSNAGEQKIPFRFIVAERPEQEDTEPKTEKNTAADTREMSAAPAAASAAKSAEAPAAAAEAEAAVQGIPNLEDILTDPVQVEKLAAELLKSGEKNPDAYLVYLQAVRCGSRLNRLYEALLEALPAAYGERLPREVYLYFAYAQDMEPALRETLYFNVLKNFGTDDDIYLAFERRIQEYAVQELLQGHVDDCLALIYDRMIYPEMIDRRIAEVFPAVLNTYRIQCSDSYTAVTVHYDCFKRDTRYPLQNGAAYVPLYMPGFVLSFRDAAGNESREVEYRCTRILEKPALEQRCFEMAPEQPMLKLRHAAEYAQRGIRSQDELERTEDAIASLDLSRAYRAELNNAILAYYAKHRTEDSQHPFVGEISYLRSIRAKKLDEKNRGILAETMIAFGEYAEAYSIILRYGVQTLERESLEQLLVYMIGRAPEQQPENLVLLAFRAFQEGTENGRILSYLLRSFSGMSLDMQDILERAMKLQRQQAMEAAQRREAVEAEMEAKERSIQEEAEVRRARSAAVRQQLREESSRISNTQRALERILNWKREETDIASENENLSDAAQSTGSLWDNPGMAINAGSRPEDEDRETLASVEANAALTEIREKAEAEEARRRDDYILDQDILSMAERLMAQMLFTRETRGLDEVYDIYLLHDGHDFMLIRAYMTIRAQGYFLQQLSVRDSFFRDLYTLVHSEKNKERLPLIYLLALTKYMSILRELSVEETEELDAMMQVLLKKKLIFAYTKKLQRFISLPDYITDKTYIEYHGDREDKPTLYVRILPDESAYHAEEISRVYQNIFVAPLTLFTGERADFQIRPMDPEKPVLKGCVEAGAPRKNHGDTYDMLNEMSSVSEKGKDETLRDLMLRYAENEAVIGVLFAGTDRNRKGEQSK